MKRIHLLILPLGISCTTTRGPEYYATFPCQNYTDTLGPQHQCTQVEGGGLDETEIRRELTSRVISEGHFLPHKEYGRTAIVFNDSGHYEARKLHFTQYHTTVEGQKTYLVYAEDSRGRFRVESNGTISMDAPEESTCSDRESGSTVTIAAHLKFVPRRQPFRTIDKRETLVAFDNNGWLKEFHGYDFWQGYAVKRPEVQWPPFPENKDERKYYRFQGFSAVIHYGCLNKGFQEFRGNEQIYLVEEFKYDQGVDPWKLKPGTRLRTDP